MQTLEQMLHEYSGEDFSAEIGEGFVEVMYKVSI
jgi:hypothetical protein